MRFSLAIVLATVQLAQARPLLPDLTVFQWDAVQGAIGAAEKAADYMFGQIASDDDQSTIWHKIKDDKKYSKLVKILNFEEDTIKILDKASDSVTFFAPNDDALHHPGKDKDDIEEARSLSDVFSALTSNPSLLSKPDKDKDHKKKVLKRIAHAILQYHLLPHAHDSQSLATNSTMATMLKPHDGSADGLHRRIRIEKHLVPPSLEINFYAKVVSSHKAKNGQLHELDHPLLPPGSIFDGMFMVPQWLSTTTSALQRVHGRHYVEWAYDHHNSKPGKPKFWGKPLATFFAPSNDAWNALPKRLKFYLFSRFGHHALEKLLAFHYVPNTLVLTEVFHGKHKKKIMSDDPSFHREYQVDSGLKGAKLNIVADKTKVLPIEGAVKISLKVNDKDVKVYDIVATNGGWHSLDEVLCPPHKKPDGHDDLTDPWANWEEWLPAWAEE